MTDSNGRSDRLDRIEEILFRFVEQQESLQALQQQQTEANNRSIDELIPAVRAIAERTNQNTDNLTITMLAVERLVPVVERVATTVEDLVRLSAETLTRIDQAFARIDAMQSEIRGLQTENRRILDVLQNRPPSDEGN